MLFMERKLLSIDHRMLNNEQVEHNDQHTHTLIKTFESGNDILLFFEKKDEKHFQKLTNYSVEWFADERLI